MITINNSDYLNVEQQWMKNTTINRYKKKSRYKNKKYILINQEQVKLVKQSVNNK